MVSTHISRIAQRGETYCCNSYHGESDERRDEHKET